MKHPHTVLALKYGGHDCAAAIMRSGELIAACEQERYTLDKHSRQFPIDAIQDCLRIAGLTEINQVDQLAFVNDLKYYVRKLYLEPAIVDDFRLEFMLGDLDRIKGALRMEDFVRERTSYTGPIHFYRHHLCHLASTYFPSGFSDALLASYDGLGEFESGMLGIGHDGQISVVHDATGNPHSLGLLYSAITHFLGWKHHCDEGIVMGLAPYGDATASIPGDSRTYYDVFAEILQATGDYDYVIDQGWMSYYRQRDTWVSERFVETFGPKRQPGGELTQHHKNIASALQRRLEDLVIAQLKRARRQFGLARLALSGGVALNCSMNGRIAASGIFDEVFVQPAAGDAGTTIGACYLASRAHNGGLQPRRLENFYTGSRFSDEEIASVVEQSGLPFIRLKPGYPEVVRQLVEGKVIAWFQGAAEFGPRALGNRSILARPYPEEMKDHINNRVKFREYFRPFAPAVLAEDANAYFDIKQASPHMLIAAAVRPEKREVIPAVVHVDGSARVQTVSEHLNPRLCALLRGFKQATGVPVLLNTSFNVKGQPIVNSPEQAIACFKSTRIDCLVLGDWFVEKMA